MRESSCNLIHLSAYMNPAVCCFSQFPWHYFWMYFLPLFFFFPASVQKCIFPVLMFNVVCVVCQKMLGTFFRLTSDLYLCRKCVFVGDAIWGRQTTCEWFLKKHSTLQHVCQTWPRIPGLCEAFGCRGRGSCETAMMRDTFFRHSD